MTLRSLLFWPHLVAGVLAGLVILTMSVTGVLLTYERQLVAWSDREFKSSVPSVETPRLSVEEIVTALRRGHPDVDVSAVTFNSQADAPVSIASGRRILYADAYTGRLLGEGNRGMRAFMSEMRAWHRWLSVDGDGRSVARAITGWSNAMFLFIVCSGFYLWFPRRWTWQRVRPVVLFAGNVRGKARDFNWHNVIGLWSFVPLFIVVLTAMPISFPWANALVYRAAGEEPPQQGGRGGPRGAGGEAVRGSQEQPSIAGFNTLWAVAEKQVPGWKTINVRIPASERSPVVFAIDKGDGGQPQHRSTVTVNRTTADIVSFETFSDQSLGRRVRSISRFAHTGEVLGLPGQTIAGLATSGAVVLVWTGLALTLRRFRAWTARRGKREAEAQAAREASAA